MSFSYWVRQNENRENGSFELQFDLNCLAHEYFKIPKSFLELQEVLRHFYFKKYNSSEKEFAFFFNAEYSYHCPNFTKHYHDWLDNKNQYSSIAEKTYSHDQDGRFFAQIDSWYQLDKNISSVLSNYEYFVPSLTIQSNIFKIKNQAPFENLFHDRNSLKGDLIIKGFIQTINLLNELYKIGFYIPELTIQLFSKILWTNILSSPRDGEILFDFPEYLRKMNKPYNLNSFWKPIFEASNFILNLLNKSASKKLEIDQTKYSITNISELVAKFRKISNKLSEQIFSEIIFYHSIDEINDEFVNEKNQKVEFSVWIDWPNVNQSVLGLDINWDELFKYLKNEIYNHENKVAIFKSAYLYYYDSQFPHKDKFHKNAAQLNLTRLKTIAAKQNKIELKPIHGDSPNENQIVDIEILEHINSIAYSEEIERYFVIISSDTDFYYGFNSLPGISKLLSRHKFVFCSFENTVSLFEELSDLNIILYRKLENLLSFLKKGN